MRREEDQLVAADALEGLQVALHGLGVLGRRVGDEVGGVLAEPGVVVGEVGLGVGLGVIAKREVGEAGEPRLALATGGRPLGFDLLGLFGEEFGRGAAGDPAVAVLGGTGEGGVDAAADQHRRAVGDVGADRLVVPDLAD